MAKAEPISVTDEGDGPRLQLEDVRIHDDVVASYFEDNATEQDLQRVLRVGVQALRAADTARDVDFVERRFEALRTAFEDELEAFETELEQTFDDDRGTVPQLLDDHLQQLEETLDERLGQEGEFIRDALDHDESPLEDVTSELGDLRKDINELRGVQSERQKGTQKGSDFEEALQTVMQQSLTGPMDDLEPTGSKRGGKGESKKGDFVITTEQGKRIAIEAKNREADMSKDDIGEYLEETLQNREADYAMMVMRNLGAVPHTKIGWFHEFDRQRLCVVLSEGPDADVEWRFLRFAYNWARVRVAHANPDADDVDAEVLDQELAEVEERIDDFESIMNTARTIQKEAKSIEDELHGMERSIMRRLHRVKREVGIES
jgi:hypothetical protein